MKGFTLLEILIALFIFTLVSMIMVTSLHSVLTAETVTEKNAARFNQLQIAMILLQHDLEQVIERPILNSANTREAALMGTSTDIRFTHAGFANPFGEITRSTLQRTHYFLNDNGLIRETWPALDLVESTSSSQRQLLDNITELRFEYLDQHGKFHSAWPVSLQTQSGLPRAIRVVITLKNSGKLSQLYLIPGQTFVISH